MKRSALLLMAMMLLWFAYATASPSTASLDGWISDAKCGAKGANAAHAQCAKKCVDQKVVAIANPEAVSGHEGQHVKVTGTMTDSGSLKVDNVVPSGGQ